MKAERLTKNERGLNTYLNGAAVNMAQPLDYPIKSGDYLQVNFIMPYTWVYQNQTMFVIQATNPYCMEMQGLNLTQNQSGPT